MKKIYALLVKKCHTDHGSSPVAVQFSFNIEELYEIANAINLQAGTWGYATVEEVDHYIAQWNFPNPNQTEISKNYLFP